MMAVSFVRLLILMSWLDVCESDRVDDSLPVGESGVGKIKEGGTTAPNRLPSTRNEFPCSDAHIVVIAIIGSIVRVGVSYFRIPV